MGSTGDSPVLFGDLAEKIPNYNFSVQRQDAKLQRISLSRRNNVKAETADER